MLLSESGVNLAAYFTVQASARLSLAASQFIPASPSHLSAIALTQPSRLAALVAIATEDNKTAKALPGDINDAHD